MIKITKIFGAKDSPFEPVGKVVEEINPAQNLSAGQKANLANTLDSLITFLLHLTVFLTPLLILPPITSSIDTPKINFLLVTTLLLTILFLAKSLFRHKTPIVRSLFDLPVVLLFLVSLVSALASPNKIVSLQSEPILFLGLTLLYFLIGSNLGSVKSATSLIRTLLLSLAIIAVWTSVAPITALLKINLPLPTIAYLNPTGSYLGQALIMVASLPLAIGYHFSLKDKAQRIVSFILLILVSLGLTASVIVSYQSRPILLDHAVAWRITTSTLGISPTSALFGIGPGNFIDAFTTFKPLDFNNSPYWNLRFSTSSNFFFYILTVLGIAGIASVILLAARFVSLARKRIDTEMATPLEKGLLASLAITFVLFVFLPGPLVLIFTLFVCLGLLVGLYNSLEIKTLAQGQENLLPTSPTIRLVFLLATAVITAGLYFQTAKLVLADYYFTNSLIAARENRGNDTYNLQIKAASLNPDNDLFRMSYSQTNLALANALAGTPNLTDQQKQLVIQLVQQAIREARLAATLQPRRAADWENLSLIYRNLINFAQGAGEWAIASQNQAIAADPTNPRLRLDLGGIYLANKDYQTAGQIFAAAVNLKPDFANAHYNLAQALKLLGLKDQAARELQQTASLVCVADAKSPDCQKINSEITDLGNQPASPSAGVKSTSPVPPTGNIENASSSAGSQNLPKAKTQPPAKISTPSGEITP